MAKAHTVFRWLTAALVFALAFWFLQRLLMPKYAADTYEGGLIREYYDEVKDHDVLIIGDCEVYENISPVTLWEEFGVTSFIRGSAQQTVWQSHYLLAEALRMETPDAVVFNVLAMQYDTPQDTGANRPAYNRLTLDDMRPSLLKYEAVRASLTPEEDIWSYAFPLLRFHDRWSQLAAADFKYFWDKPDASISGFTLRADVRGVDVADIPAGMKRPDYQFGANAYRYLDMITGLCQDAGVPLMLIKAPVHYPYWYPEWDAQMVEYAERNGLRYINFIPQAEAMGLDFTQDTYDGGLHLNVYGAEKFSRALGAELVKAYGLADRRGEPGVTERQAEKTAAYERMKAAQAAEFNEKGQVFTFLVEP